MQPGDPVTHIPRSARPGRPERCSLLLPDLPRPRPPARLTSTAPAAQPRRCSQPPGAGPGNQSAWREASAFPACPAGEEQSQPSPNRPPASYRRISGRQEDGRQVPKLPAGA